MKCLSPTVAFVCGKIVAKDGVVSDNLVFSPKAALQWLHGCGYSDVYLSKIERLVPCGHCAACMLQKRKDYSVRLAKELQMHESACFVTLTYNDENIPFVDGAGVFCRGSKNVPHGTFVPTLLPSDVQKFLKRLRRWLTYRPVKSSHAVRDYCPKLRYFCVGEYGSRTSRPHYHLIIFGWRPSDLVLHSQINGRSAYRSSQIERNWTHGFSLVEDSSVGTAMYCARYVTKKFLSLIDAKDSPRVGEFILTSRRGGGIGAPWCDKFGEDAVRQQFTTVKYRDFVARVALPKYFYDRVRKKNQAVWIFSRDARILWYNTHKQTSADVFDSVLRDVEFKLHQYRSELKREIL